MKDLLGNEEDDVEEAASQLMPVDVVEELVGESDTAAEVRREVSRPGSGLAKLWETLVPNWLLNSCTCTGSGPSALASKREQRP